MLDHLNNYLRATLGSSRASRHSLQDEFARIADYLAIMAIRMGPRLSFALDLPASLQQAQVPALILQPLVENAIKHGLEPSVQGGHIGISARRAGDDVQLEVADSGVGLATEGTAGQGFGLAQVHERLHTLFGNQARLELAATASRPESSDATNSVAFHAYKTMATVVFPCTTRPDRLGPA
jgi:LytS/YehU family sensor histidine kinase